MNRTDLIRLAEQSTRHRGHELRNWTGNGLDFALAYCKRCGCQVTVNASPAPNEIDIGGRAVALDCQHERDKIIYAQRALAFILKPGQYTFEEWADRIAQVYDVSYSNPKVAAVYEALFYRGNWQIEVTRTDTTIRSKNFND